MEIYDKVKGFDYMVQKDIGLKRISISKIDQDTMRDGIYLNHIENIKRGIKNKTFNIKEQPISVFKIGGIFHMGGNHRVYAFKELGRKYIYAKVIECRRDKRRKKGTYE